MSFGSRIKDLRKKFNLSQVDLGKGIGVSGTTISQYEADSRFPDKSTLVKICKFLDISSDYLLGLMEEEPQSLNPERILINCEEFTEDQLETIRLLMRAFLVINKKGENQNG